MDDMEPTPQQLLAALDASELVDSVGVLTEGQRHELLDRVALLVGANHSVSIEEFRGELTDILDSGPTFHAVLHGGQFDGQVMELDPERFDADMICAPADAGSDVSGTDDSDLRVSGAPTSGRPVRGEADGTGASAALPSLYRISAGEPAPGATVHYQFGGLVHVDPGA